MKLKQYVRFGIDFSGTWSRICAAFMGLSFFLRIVNYFGLLNLHDCGSWEKFIYLIFPMIVCIAFMILFSAIKWNAPGIYAIIGCVFCLLLMIWNISTGGALRIFLSVLVYVVLSVALLATAGGYVPSAIPATLLIFLVLICRILIYSLNQDGLSAYLLEISELSILVSLLGFTGSLKGRSVVMEET